MTLLRNLWFSDPLTKQPVVATTVQAYIQQVNVLNLGKTII
jgi:hypothetical protein